MNGLLVASAGSGAGKTSVACGIVRSLARRGIAVRTAKCGPDFLDPAWLARAGGKTCWNLDPWMMGDDHVRSLVQGDRARGEFLVVEGAMGLYDSVDPSSDEGSAFHVAKLLDLGILLVLDAKAQARTFASVVQGLRDFGPARVVGVVANRVGSDHHGQILAEALASRDLPPLWGWIAAGELPALPGRHLGLSAEAVSEELLEALADVVDRRLESSVLEVGPMAVPPPRKTPALGSRARLGVSADEAFLFRYADQLEAMERSGIEVVPTSPLADTRLPDGIQGLWLCGGYPELHGERLSGNTGYLSDLRKFCDGSRPVLAECGGLMLLCRSVVDDQGREHSMAGVVPTRAVMGSRLSALGHVEVEVSDKSWLSGGGSIRGHEFHWGYLEQDPREWDPLFSRAQARGRATCGGWRRGGVAATWVHLHLASRPGSLEGWVRAMEEVEPWNA